MADQKEKQQPTPASAKSIAQMREISLEMVYFVDINSQSIGLVSWCIEEIQDEWYTGLTGNLYGRKAKKKWKTFYINVVLIEYACCMRVIACLSWRMRKSRKKYVSLLFFFAVFFLLTTEKKKKKTNIFHLSYSGYWLLEEKLFVKTWTEKFKRSK